MSDQSGIEVYPVGMLHDLLRMRNTLRHRGIRWEPIKSFLRQFNMGYRRRSYWSGYLAEWHYCPDGVNHTKCGSGWTKREAMRRLGAHIVASNMIEKRSF